MPRKRHRLSFQTYDVVPTWAYITYCRRSRAAHVIQSSYKNYARRRDERAAKQGGERQHRQVGACTTATQGGTNHGTSVRNRVPEPVPVVAGAVAGAAESAWALRV